MCKPLNSTVMRERETVRVGVRQRGLACDIIEQGGLADAAFADDQDTLHLPGVRGVKRGGNASQFRRAADELIGLRVSTINKGIGHRVTKNSADRLVRAGKSVA